MNNVTNHCVRVGFCTVPRDLCGNHAHRLIYKKKNSKKPAVQQPRLTATAGVLVLLHIPLSRRRFKKDKKKKYDTKNLSNRYCSRVGHRWRQVRVRSRIQFIPVPDDKPLPTNNFGQSCLETYCDSYDPVIICTLTTRFRRVEYGIQK